MFIDKYRARIKKRGFFTFILLVILGFIVVCNSVEWQAMSVIWMIVLIIFVIRTLLALRAQKYIKTDIGKIVELTDADSGDKTILFSGKIVDVMYYKPYNRVCAIVDTRGYINTRLEQDRGNTIVLFNRYAGETLIGNRIVNTYVPKNDIVISDEKECLEYSDFLVFCDLKYKK